MCNIVVNRGSFIIKAVFLVPPTVCAKEIPLPTRHQGEIGGAQGKTVAHLYDTSVEALTDVVFSGSSPTQHICCVVLDGSEPGSMLG